MNKYKKALDSIVSTIIEEKADGYLEPRTAGDFYGIDPFTKVHEIIDNCEVIK